MRLKFGDIFWSEYFQSKGVVVEYWEDTDWYFVLKSRPKQVLKAQSPPSALKWLRLVE